MMFVRTNVPYVSFMGHDGPKTAWSVSTALTMIEIPPASSIMLRRIHFGTKPSPPPPAFLNRRIPQT